LATSPKFDASYVLDDRYSRESGRVFLTGNQALVRLPLMQRRRDLAAGLNTAGFISGYRGSPLGTLDMNLWQAKVTLDEHEIRFEPGLNEDLAATAVWGSQQSMLHENPQFDGVFGMWYGKGPGVDRACDALKHANYAGTSANGGVLALMGDDPGAKSSSIAHQSETAMIHCGIPVMNPATVQDYLDFGLYGWALSRYSGSWVGFKCLTDTVESSGSVLVSSDRARIVRPTDFEMPPGGLHISWGNLPLQVEARVFEQRLVAVRAFVRANGIDRVALGSDRSGPRRLGIVTTGKAYGDLRQALVDIGIDDTKARSLGLSIYKVGVSWPLESEGLREFASGLDNLLVIEEKKPIMEEQISNLLFNLSDRPRLFGKQDLAGRPLVPGIGELTPLIVAGVLRHWIADLTAEDGDASSWQSALIPAPDQATVAGPKSGLMRLPSFCSGCPHNRSTVVPEGSVALGGIGCHGMAVWLPERRTLAVTQMGGEGANWIGQSPFSGVDHIFQNMGDGTYFHSGLLAIRAAIAAKVNITYKILVNGAVAMTGGQPIEGEDMAGEITTPEIARQLAGEGIRRIAVLSDDVEKYSIAAFPAGVTIHHRNEIDRVQKELRQIGGVTALLYDQTCAAEARRLRKRGQFPDPDRRVVINELVCEGCGDCSVQSNCISIEPVETEFGRKRRINQSSCNKDYSCLEGYCPSFATIVGGRLRNAVVDNDSGVRGAQENRLFAELPDAPVARLDEPFNIFVAGIGGTGVITVGALIGMAAHLEGKGTTLLDVTGLAQKNGAVASHVRVSRDSGELYSTRISPGAADLLLGCDIVVSTGQDGMEKLSGTRTRAIVNTHVAPLADFASSPDMDFSSKEMESALLERLGGDRVDLVDATRIATEGLGDAIAANLFLVGFALQKGLMPIGLPALEMAIELNGKSIELNRRALAWGRLAAHDWSRVQNLIDSRGSASSGEGDESMPGLDEIIATRFQFLTDYQDAAYAKQYEAFVEAVRGSEEASGVVGARLATAVARNLFKLMAVKDEYEVMRLWADVGFERQLDHEFEGDYKIQFHLAPQMFFPRDPDTGRARKLTLSRRAMSMLKLLRHLKFLRNTPFDPFNRTAHRRREWGLVGEYKLVVGEILEGLSMSNHELALELAEIPAQIRGFDSVKDVQLAAAKEREAILLRDFRTSVA